MFPFNALVRRLEAVPMHMRVLARENIGSHIHKITLALPEDRAAHFPVGSYIQPMIAGVVPRAYSVVEGTNHSCTILVSSSGNGVGARFFRDIEVGQAVTVFGPFDDFPYHPGTGRQKIFLATGTGVAPFVGMAKEAIAERTPSLLVLGVPTEADIPYRAFFESKCDSGLFNCIFVLSRPGPAWTGTRGYVTDQFSGPRNEQLLRESDVYVCGVPPMVAGTMRMLKQAQVPKTQIFIQKFG